MSHGDQEIKIRLLTKAYIILINTDFHGHITYKSKLKKVKVRTFIRFLFVVNYTRNLNYVLNKTA